MEVSVEQGHLKMENCALFFVCNTRQVKLYGIFPQHMQEKMIF